MVHTSQLEYMLEQLMLAVESLSMGRFDKHDQLFAMTDSTQYPPFIARFAEAFAMMTVKVEAREFRLELIIEDLTRTKEELIISNQRLQQSLLELKQAQMQLIQQEKMESIGRLAAGVAHEVKNPLAVIQLGTDFLAGQLKGNPVWHETVTDMADAVQRADTVIKGLLDFSRSEQLELQPTDIEQLIKDSLLLVRHDLTSRQITVISNLAADLPQLLLDSNKIKQVFINIFVNAAHAMQEGGVLTISSAIQAINDEDLVHFGTFNGQRAAGDRVVKITVADTGIGIKEEAVSKLFDPFFTTKPVGIGTGLGLSVTRKILELHHAVITLQNRTDRQGAEAVLLFTINQTKPKEHTP
jgi:signal transduction histidine kinase